MKLLVVSDLHYSLKQFDWLVANRRQYDLIVFAGDMMELGSYVDADTQAAVVEQYFRKICHDVPMVVCSGNHDLVEEGEEGQRSPEWLQELAIPGLVVDEGCYEGDGVRIISLPWWEDESQRSRVGQWLEEMGRGDDGRVEIWVNHAPPAGAKTSWNGKRDLGDPTLEQWIRRYSPDLVFSGHVHNAPYYEEGSWIDRVGTTVVTNGGYQIGEVPATIAVEVEGGRLTWCGMEGCHDASIAQG